MAALDSKLAAMRAMLASKQQPPPSSPDQPLAKLAAGPPATAAARVEAWTQLAKVSPTVTRMGRQLEHGALSKHIQRSDNCGYEEADEIASSLIKHLQPNDMCGTEDTAPPFPALVAAAAAEAAANELKVARVAHAAALAAAQQARDNFAQLKRKHVERVNGRRAAEVTLSPALHLLWLPSVSFHVPPCLRMPLLSYPLALREATTVAKRTQMPRNALLEARLTNSLSLSPPLPSLALSTVAAVSASTARQQQPGPGSGAVDAQDEGLLRLRECRPGLCLFRLHQVRPSLRPHARRSCLPRTPALPCLQQFPADLLPTCSCTLCDMS